MPSGFSDESFILFDSCTRNNHFLLGKMLETLGKVPFFLFLFIFFPLKIWNQSHLLMVGRNCAVHLELEFRGLAVYNLV